MIAMSETQRAFMRYWLPAAAAGALALIIFVLVGNTPPVRALALAGTVTGIAATLRRFGALLAFSGGLVLGFSPAFWSQTGGGDNGTLATVALLLGIAALVTAGAAWLSKRPGLGVAIGLVVFAVLFWGVVGTPRSLRITTLISAWTLFLLVDALLTAHPRPDGPPPAPLRAYHTRGLLLLFVVGVINDPLFTLLAPALIVSLLVCRTALPRWYWALVIIAVIIGARGIAAQYLDSGWWLYPAEQAEALGIRVPYVMADGWREASRWLALGGLVLGQFTVGGLMLGALGLARLSRWYPPLGVITLIAYAGYALFGLVYFGRDSAVLLLPLLMIQVFWMTYAVYSLGQWLQRSSQQGGVARWLAPAAFTLAPLLMLFRIFGIL